MPSVLISAECGKEAQFWQFNASKDKLFAKRHVLKVFYLPKIIFSGMVDLDVIDVWHSSLFPNPSAVPELQFGSGGILDIVVNRAVQPCVTAGKPVNRKCRYKDTSWLQSPFSKLDFEKY